VRRTTSSQPVISSVDGAGAINRLASEDLFLFFFFFFSSWSISPLIFITVSFSSSSIPPPSPLLLRLLRDVFQDRGVNGLECVVVVVASNAPLSPPRDDFECILSR